VESIHLYSSGNRGLIVNMLSAGDFITVDILQSFESEQFVNELLRSLDEAGLTYHASVRVDFATALDRTSSTGRWQRGEVLRRTREVGASAYGSTAALAAVADAAMLTTEPPPDVRSTAHEL